MLDSDGTEKFPFWKEKMFEITAELKCTRCGGSQTVTARPQKRTLGGNESESELLNQMSTRFQSEQHSQCYLLARKPTIKINHYTVKKL